MAETSKEQVAFGWAVPSPSAEALPRPPARTPERPAAQVCEPQLPPDNELWDVHAAARFLKRSVSWVYHRAEDGTLPVRRLGGWGVRFIPAELRAWVERGASLGRRR
jgi:predicted DNA-binding transcriptional regulator AlpA